jgi:LAGLIDADG DNA endonuclease family
VSKGKTIVKDGLIRDHLTPRGLAYWFCDDGGKLDYSSNKGKGIVFNTHSFTALSSWPEFHQPEAFCKGTSPAERRKE